MEQLRELVIFLAALAKQKYSAHIFHSISLRLAGCFAVVGSSKLLHHTMVFCFVKPNVITRPKSLCPPYSPVLKVAHGGPEPQFQFSKILANFTPLVRHNFLLQMCLIICAPTCYPDGSLTPASHPSANTVQHGVISPLPLLSSNEDTFLVAVEESTHPTAQRNLMQQVPSHCVMVGCSSLTPHLCCTSMI